MTIEVRCANCGIAFDVKPSRIKRLKRFEICCSKECTGNLKSKEYLSDKNPNHRYDKDLSMFYDLTNDGAYILGLIYSDGHLNEDSIEIYQHERYGYNLHRISNKIFGFENIHKRTDGILTLAICDKKLVEFILSLGGIQIGYKADMVSLPNIPEDKMWSFIAGYFDGDGGFKYNYRYPEINISSTSSTMLSQIAAYWDVNYSGGDRIESYGYKALDICGKMYGNVSFRNNLKYDYYSDILNWEPLHGGKWFKNEYFKFKKLDRSAIPPTKSRVTDSGYDVCAISLTKEGPFYVADTRLAIEPIPGYYFELFGRSSLPAKFGFTFALGTGIIDRSYTGSLKMYLLKIDDRPLPELPFKCGQIIPRKIIHMDFIEVDELSATSRGDGGFGSTGR